MSNEIVQPITLYTTDWCPYCVRARALLKARKYPFTEVNVEGDDAKRAWLLQVTGRKTVPQVFIGERSVGGFDDLSALDRSGELAVMVRRPVG
ncbi:MAG: glutaredoxin 3 [Polyangiales bacterium]